MYLPVYMWTLDCRKRGVNLFWELLDLISMCDGEKISHLKIIEVNICQKYISDKLKCFIQDGQEKSKTDDKIRCLYCGNKCKCKQDWVELELNPRLRQLERNRLKQAEAVMGSTLQLRPGLTLYKVVLNFGQLSYFFLFSRNTFNYFVFVS